MKYKKLLISAAVLTFVGAVCLAGALFLAGFDTKKLSNRVYTEQLCQFDGSLNLSVYDDNNAILIMPSSTDTIQIRYLDCEDEWYEITESDGKVTIEKKTKPFMFHFFMFDFTDTTLQIQIPKDYQGTLNIDTSNARIDAVEIAAGNAWFASSNGSIYIGDSRFAALRVADSNAYVGLNNVAADSISAVTSNANLRLDEVVCPDMIFKTSNGDITGSVVGDYHDYEITYSTTNGRGSGSSQNGPNKISAYTSNGDIRIQFVQTAS